MPKKEQEPDKQELVKAKILTMILEKDATTEQIGSLVHSFYLFTQAENMNATNFLNFERFEFEQHQAMNKKDGDSLKNMLNQ